MSHVKLTEYAIATDVVSHEKFQQEIKELHKVQELQSNHLESCISHIHKVHTAVDTAAEELADRLDEQEARINTLFEEHAYEAVAVSKLKVKIAALTYALIGVAAALVGFASYVCFIS